MSQTAYRYRPVLFFALAYLFTWIFWIPTIWVSEDLGALLMAVGLLAPAVVIVLANKEMFFETRHVGRLLESVSAEQE